MRDDHTHAAGYGLINALTVGRERGFRMRAHLPRSSCILSLHAGVRVSPTSTPLAYYMLGQAGAIMNSSDLLWPNGGNRPRDLLDILVQITAVGRSWVVLDRRLPVALSAGWREVGLRPVTATGMRGKVRCTQSASKPSDCCVTSCVTSSKRVYSSTGHGGCVSHVQQLAHTTQSHR